MAKETILIIEDEKSILKLIKYNLEKSGFNAIAAKSGEDALKILSGQQIDLAVIDIMLPGMDGLDVCKHIRQDSETKNMPVIILTAKGESIDRVVGFEVGADDYIVKPFSPRELVLRIKAILKRGKAEDPAQKEIVSAFDISVNIPKHEVTVKGKVVDLTNMEFKLLCTLIQRRGRVQTREKLLDDVWGIDTMIETRTIDTHVKSLRTKLGKAGKAVETVHGMGYRFSDRD
ncbi:MAG: response regulator transcription factor [Candidatus Omnitrophica bacterium]|nr:response regulator transcription factor [Candidatus Omnitrophota bacterium]